LALYFTGKISIQARSVRFPSARTKSLGRYSSGQRGETVNLLAQASEGSNPSLPTRKTKPRLRVFCFSNEKMRTAARGVFDRISRLTYYTQLETLFLMKNRFEVYSEDDHQSYQHLSPQEIEARAEESLDMVIDTLRTSGIELAKRPKILFKDEPCVFHKDALASAKTDISTSKKLLSVVGADILKAGMARFGLKLSDVAIDQSVKVTSQLAQSLFPKGMSEEDIVLYGLIRRELGNLNGIIAHEVWHLIEDQRGIFASESFTHEGTATFVQSLFSTQKSEISDPCYHLIYNVGAEIVEREVHGEQNPLLALLNPAVRARIEACFKAELLPLLHTTIVKSFNPHAGDAFWQRRLKSDPIYQEFKENPSPATYLLSLQKQGYHQMAQELSSQNVEHIVQHMKDLLESAK
jgi:hypothetical protein